MKMKRDELIGCGIVFLFGGITTVLSWRMPIGTFRMAGSGLFPLCLGILLMILSLLYLLSLLFGKKGAPPEQKPDAAIPANAPQVLKFLGITVGAVFCLGIFGYPAFCLLIMWLLLWILGVRRPVPLWGISLATAVGSYLLFVRFLKIPLPKGLIGL